MSDEDTHIVYLPIRAPIEMSDYDVMRAYAELIDAQKALSAEVEQLRAENESEYKRCACEVDPASETGEPYAWCMYHKKLRDETKRIKSELEMAKEHIQVLRDLRKIDAARRLTERNLAKMPDSLISKCRRAYDSHYGKGSMEEEIFQGILAWYEESK